MGDTLTADDRKLLAAIMDTQDPALLATRVYDYYHDLNRADRTSRQSMYLHMGMLSGAVMRVLEKAKR